MYRFIGLVVVTGFALFGATTFATQYVRVPKGPAQIYRFDTGERVS